jgi:hypothetical protein
MKLNATATSIVASRSSRLLTSDIGRMYGGTAELGIKFDLMRYKPGVPKQNQDPRHRSGIPDTSEPLPQVPPSWQHSRRHQKTKTRK